MNENYQNYAFSNFKRKISDSRNIRLPRRELEQTERSKGTTRRCLVGPKYYQESIHLYTLYYDTSNGATER